ncbi:P-loop containing nucleoside triphosphate hydrolase protein [Daedaleopsis nitida]|nr:P-loop containing nucleoside triphosphate hydrolase protein [Daedaleopsis nitida]
MRPLPSAIPPTWAQFSSRTIPRAHPLAQARCFHKGPRDNVREHSHPDEYSFERLSLQPSVLSALRLAFPSIKHPTPIQHRFIDAVLHGKDVLLKDKTGTGKSFALALALLSQQRGLPVRLRRTGERVPTITSLLLVPHRDLAYQFYHWIERIHHHMPQPPPLPSLAQVLTRDSSTTLQERLAPIQSTPPQILISTPQAVYDVIQADENALHLERLSTVVVDEVDYLVESVPILSDKYAMMKIERQINRHPGPTRRLLNHIYSSDNLRRRDSYQMYQKKGDDHRRDDSRAAPQLVMMSATLRNHLKRFLLADSGWFTKERNMLVRITGDASAHYPQELKNNGAEDQASFAVGGTALQHHVLVVSQHGDITNIEGAVAAPSGQTEASKQPSVRPESPVELPPSTIQAQVDREELDEPSSESPFDPVAMEAIVTAFVLDVPSVALLVLPSDAPVMRAVHDLRLLGVNAHPLDVVKEENGRTHLMRRDFDSTAENPTLLVSTLASTRGLDLPELSHVFILGILDGGAVDSYLHVAGRVGRFGRGGKVISVVADRHEVLEANGKKKTRDEPQLMGNMFKKMGIRPVKFEEFD